MSSGYRSWEEREADAEKTRAEAERLKAETAAFAQQAVAAAARTETEQIAEQVKQARLLKQLTAVEADAADDATERKEKRTEARLDKGVAFKQLVTTLVVLGLLASLPSLIAYFLGLRAEDQPDTGPAWYLLSVPFFLELLAWTSVKGTQWAARRGFVRWPFWILTLGLAGYAGLINGTKGAEMFGPIAGWALASTSIFGPVLWEVRELIEARTAADNRSVAERAADKAKARAERATAKAEAAQDADRRKTFPDEYNEYRRIMISHPLGKIDRDAAWERAWTNQHGLPVSVTADTLVGQADARDAIREVMSRADNTAEALAVERFLGELFPTDPKGDDDPGGSPAKRGPQRPPQTPTALGGLDKQPSGRAPRRDATEALAKADIDRAREYLTLVGEAQFSAPAVAKLLGRSHVYARRIRNAVNEKKEG
ncbi:hypothetical protein J7E97_08085 [Streptomyces sp. ISL-66]|uniref:hypothetical protein n=1 Tax=Streptomyces sp. ISL-66 TaxID=2819186 RepID=UPI001BE93CAD|nr:hypothetical protein [Streptomyces sp. ISL-66]MBT2467832.1 hypothetical protein [Streptomyces sp. ISL-66]